MKVDWYNVLRTVVQALIVFVGAALPLLTAEMWRSLGIDSQAVSVLLGAGSLAVAAWWRQRYQHAFEPKG